MEPDKEARIRERAYEIWVREGRPHGRDAEHWQKAEAEIAAESGPADHAAAGSKPGTEAATAPTAPPSVPSSNATAPLRSRRAAKPASGASGSGGGGRRGRKTSDT